MRSIYISLPLIVITSLIFLLACSESTLINSSQSRESRSGISSSGKYRSGSTANRRGNRDRSVSGSIIPTISESNSVSAGIPTTSRATVTQSISTLSPTPSPVNVVTKKISYSTDHGKEQVSIQFNISYTTDGQVTSLNAIMLSGDHESKQYIARFNSAAKSKIVGKKITDLSLSAIGGASDTTDAFSQVIASL